MALRVQHRLRSREDRAPSARCQSHTTAAPPRALDLDPPRGKPPLRSVVAVRTEDFWLEKRAHSLSRLVGLRPLLSPARDTDAITPPPSSSMLRQSLFDSDDAAAAAAATTHPENDVAWDLTKESLSRTDSSASLYNDWSQSGSGLLPGSLRALSEVCEQSAWLWCGDLPLPDSPDSTFEDGTDSEAARVLHETFLPTMESDDGILNAMLEAAGRNSKIGTPLGLQSQQLVHLLEDCVETFAVGDDTDSDSDDDVASSEGGNDAADPDNDGSESDGSNSSENDDDGSDDNDDSDSMSEMCCTDYDLSCSEGEEEATPCAGAGIAASATAAPMASAATSSFTAALQAATSPPRPPPPAQSHSQASAHQPVADLDRNRRPAGVFSFSTHGISVPPTPAPLNPQRHLIPHRNFPHPGSAGGNKPLGHVFAPPTFYHSLSSAAVASAAAAALQPSRDLLLQSRGVSPAQGAAAAAMRGDPRRCRRDNDATTAVDGGGDGMRDDDNDDDDERVVADDNQHREQEDVASDDCGADGDGEDEGDGNDAPAKKVKAIRVRRLTVDRSHRCSIPSPLQLWEYVLHILELGKLRECIRWIDADRGSFKIVDSVSLGRQWGAYRHKPKMNYDKMSRAMRYYYRRNIFVQIDGRLVYQFSEPVMRQVRSYRKSSGKARGRT